MIGSDEISAVLLFIDKKNCNEYVVDDEWQWISMLTWQNVYWLVNIWKMWRWIV